MNGCVFKTSTGCGALNLNNMDYSGCPTCWAKCTDVEDLKRRYNAILSYPHSKSTCNNDNIHAEYKRFLKKFEGVK